MLAEAEALRTRLEGLYRLARKLNAHRREWVTSLAFDREGKRIASSSTDDTLKIWDVAGGECLRTISAPEDVSSTAWSPTDSHLAWAVGHRLMVQDLRPGASLAPVLNEDHLQTIVSVAFSPSGRQIATGSSDDTVRLCELQTMKCLATFPHAGNVNCVAFSPDGRLIISGGDDGLVSIWDIAARKLTRTLTGHKGKVLAVALSPDVSLAASGGRDKAVHLFDLAEGKPLKPLTGHTRTISSVAFSPNGRLLASAGGDETIRLWDLKTRQCIQVLRGHQEWVRVVRFSPDGGTLVSGGDDGVVIFWARGLKAASATQAAASGPASRPPGATKPASQPAR